MIDKSNLQIIDGINKGLSTFSNIFNIYSILIYFTYLKYKLNSTKIELIVWLIIVNTLLSIPAYFPSYLVYNQNNNVLTLCLIKSILYILFSYSQSIICCILGYTSLLNILKPEHIENRKVKFKLIFGILSFGVPLLMISM